MNIEFNCPECGQLLTIDSKYTGTNVQCPQCKAETIVPKPEPAISQPMKRVTSDEYKNPSQGFVIAGWIIFALAFLTSFSNRTAVGIGSILVIVSWFMVGIDARKLKINELRYSSLDLSTYDRSSASAWVAGCILLWIVFFPMYLIKRKKIALAVYDTIAGSLYMQAEEKASHARKLRNQTVRNVLILLAFIATVVGIYRIVLK